ncbi:MAG: bifunctional 4-hydroxy-2-oxoglutarate aldolase/2-dehydro-3-deoxy-phosphogluconate aldolase [Candidatus Bipolaricaulota bacterium]|nr:bifunctional 4-hydroxy-2-oxoglutarate aldolase/2-dehydro-3-deoxy-phosphogluconate aldolase [Candidatus Bipolaricaulota bacterium]
MEKISVLQRIRETGVIGIIRISTKSDLLALATAATRGGLSVVEITLTSPGALSAIDEGRRSLSEVILGAGSVLDAPTARAAILAGAQFLVTPTVRGEVAEVAHRYGVPVIVGAMTPTEILTAWEQGADLVKVFPASVLGPRYLHEVHGPLPQVPLVPTGGITAETAPAFVRAGAYAVCVGSWLLGSLSVEKLDYTVITERARQIVGAVRDARRSLEGKTTE